MTNIPRRTSLRGVRRTAKPAGRQAISAKAVAKIASPRAPQNMAHHVRSDASHQRSINPMFRAKYFRKFLVLSLLGFFLSPSLSRAAVYKVDVDHTTVSFKVRHLFSKVEGRFNKFEGTVDYEPGKPEAWKTSGVIDAASINTNVLKRDNHLRSADFFDVEKYPTISFKSGKVINSTDTRARLEGLLTIHGVERPVILDVQMHGVGKDPWGNTRAGFTATTQINRKDFGLAWNQTLETGGVLIGEEVEIILEIEGVLTQ